MLKESESTDTQGKAGVIDKCQVKWLFFYTSSPFTGITNVHHCKGDLKEAPFHSVNPKS